MQDQEYVDFELPEEDANKNDQSNAQQEIIKSG